ncbi:MAG: glycine cleavage system protein GcvH [FCB group bacterium]|nr:glycine cleavage system protein GcvH [FCB group bacterium]
MNVPDDLKYSADHEWVRADGETVTVGITDYAQGELGDVIFIEFPEPGDTVAAGDTFGTVEAVKTVADLFAPLSGEVLEVNSALEDSPESVNKDPYGTGWIVRIKAGNPEELTRLMDAKAYREHIS